MINRLWSSQLLYDFNHEENPNGPILNEENPLVPTWQTRDATKRIGTYNTRGADQSHKWLRLRIRISSGVARYRRLVLDPITRINNRDNLPISVMTADLAVITRLNTDNSHIRC